VPTGGGPREIIVARFSDIDQPLTQTLFSLLLKPQVVHIGLGDGRASRFLMGSAGNLHVMRVPACLEYNPALFDSAPYETVALARGDPERAAQATPASPQQAGSFRVTFYRVPFRC
jgi:hypothetical protein